MSFVLNTPILFLIFNRPELTRRVFETIRLMRPKYLYVAADGPRANLEGEREKCEASRAIVQQIEWDCNLKTLFGNVNLGCGKAVSSAITWFFENVEEGIVLEDDCVPHPDFFPYCEEMLNHYRAMEKVMFIGGTNFQDGKRIGNASYYFSLYSHVWGWASWRRVWKEYNFTLEGISWIDLKSYLQQQGFHNDAIIYWRNIFEMMKNNPIDTWDYQFVFSIWRNKGISIIPNVNLVKNTGFGAGATHTTEIHKSFSNIQTASVFPIKHTEEISINWKADKRYYHRKVEIKRLVKIRIKIFNLIKRLKNPIAKIII